jgi:hypothetical protein
LEPLHDAWYQVNDEKLVVALETHWREATRRRGRPSAELSSLLIWLVVDHLKAHGHAPQYRDVGQIAASLFPDAFDPAVAADPDLLREAAEDRYWLYGNYGGPRHRPSPKPHQP